MTRGTDGNREWPPGLALGLLLLLAMLTSACSPNQMALQGSNSEPATTTLIASAHANLAASFPTDPEPPENLWHRLQRSFMLDDSERPEVAEQRQLLLKHPLHLDQVQEQAAPYIGYVLDEIEQRGMPGELALVPMIESGYRPEARSPSRAAGLWQFIPATGRAFGLSSNRWYEGRQDVAESTRAALDYFSRINQEFRGDWALTLAAYNAGEPAIRRAIYKNRKRGKPTDFWSLELPDETRKYVPKLLALKQLFEQPERHGLILTPLYAEHRLQRVELHAPTDLGLIARLAEIGMDTLRKLNPGLKTWFTGPDGPHHLLLPADRVEQLHERLASLPDSQRMRLRTHRVQKGDTLAKLATRYKTNAELIRRANNLEGNRLKQASLLLIPTPPRADANTSNQAALAPAPQTQPGGFVTNLPDAKPAG